MAIFVDTGAWYASSVPSDPDHAAASSFIRSNSERLVTSDYIYAELLTLFRTRGHPLRAKDWVDQTRQGRHRSPKICRQIDLRRRLPANQRMLVPTFFGRDIWTNGQSRRRICKFEPPSGIVTIATDGSLLLA